MYVYLMDGDEPICFYRESILKYVSNKDAPLEWQSFEPDTAVGKVFEPENAGLFSFRLYIHDITSLGAFNPTSTIPSWKGNPPSRLKPWNVRVAIYQCESLPPADSNGTSDPYVKVWSHEKEKQNIRT